MQYRPLGQSGISASVIAQGTWALGGMMWGGTDEKRSIASLHASIDAGVNLIDTAPAYGFGISEEFIGKAIAGRRDKVVLATKAGLRWDDTKGMKFKERDGVTLYRYLGPESIREELERSLKRLKVETIDLYQTHWQDPTTPIAASMGTLLDLKKEGKIRAIGVSNCTVEQLKEYQAAGPVDCVQERYSMLDREMEQEYLPYCLANNIAVLAYSPMAMGLLTGKMGPERLFPADDLRHDHPRFTKENRTRIQNALQRLEPIARKYGLTTGGLVVAWTLAQPGLTHVLAGARDGAQAKENARAAVELSAEDLEQITAASNKGAM
jgi:aryl-alcohol dehydrogenase-like predicted oxidoreductase